MALQNTQSGGAESEPSEIGYESLNQLVGDVQKSLEQNKNTLAEVNKLAETVKKQNKEIARQNKDISDQKDTVRTTQAIVILGFVLALITLVAVVITDWTFMRDSMKQTTEQTVLLQQINDKVNGR